MLPIANLFSYKKAYKAFSLENGIFNKKIQSSYTIYCVKISDRQKKPQILSDPAELLI